MFKIVQAPHNVLSEKAKPIAKIDKAIQQLVKQMEETLDNAKDPQGVGLAAPQIGKSLQLFVIKQTSRSPMRVFINPNILTFIDEKPEETPKENEKPDEEKKGIQLEGCLSLKDIWGQVKRHPALILEYEDENGEKHKRKFEGFLATIIQHEYDHLQGILFPKRVLEQNNDLYKSSKNTKGETVFDEIEI